MREIIIAILGWLGVLGKGEIVKPAVIEISGLVPTEVVELTTMTTLVPTKIVVKAKPQPTDDNEPWGVAKQVGEHTYTMKIEMDSRMGTPKEILEALNSYRVRRGSQRLTWDEKLASYAESRVKYLASIKNVDGHAGFQNYLEKENGFEKLGFTRLGENISYGYQMEGVHLIEWIYAGDKPHDDNQVNNNWNYVGIGVEGTATCLIFGTGKS